MHSRAGRISAISDAGDGKYSRISVTHGKRKKSKQSGELEGYHRHESTHYIPTSDAKGYSIGQRVHSGLEAAGFDEQEGPTEAESVPGKQVSKAKGKLMAAMSRGRK